MTRSRLPDPSFRVGFELTAEALFTFPDFRRQDVTEVFSIEDLADFDFALFVKGIGSALDPLDSFFLRFDIKNPIAGDEFFGFGKGTVDDSAVFAGEADARAFGTGMEAFARQHDASLSELFVESGHIGDELRIG